MGDLKITFLERLPLTRRAVAFAADQHGSERRGGDEAPFMLHVLEVASLLDRSDYPDGVVAAAVLHDVLENTGAERADLDECFGPEIGEIVSQVSDDGSIPGQEQQKDELRERVRATPDDTIAIVYASDKVSKVRELRLRMTTDPGNPENDARLDRYWKALAMLEERLPGERIVALLRFELEALQAFPPAPGAAPG